MRKATIKDVAKIAGVCPSTVSRVLSGNASISDETAEKVRNAAKQLNYTLNTAARSLRCEKSRSIGVVFPDIAGEFYAECASAILKHARTADYTVLFTESGHDFKSEQDSINALMQRCIDGLIFIGDSNDDAILYKLHSESVPIITGDRKLGDIPSVTFDNRKTVSELTQSLYKSGRRKFVYLGETTDGQNNLIERYQGFIDALGKHTDAEVTSILDESLHFDKAKNAYRLFEEKIMHLTPDAIVTSNDLIAHGIMSAATEHCLKIPSDIAITGFDDMTSSAYFTPSLTTVRQDTDALAKECFGALLKLIEKEKVTSKVLKQEIIIRKSALGGAV